jgi:membrane-bound ClpP family serine protease
VRRIISFALALALVIGGGVLCLIQLMVAYEDGTFRGAFGLGAASMMILGSYWLYEDFWRPRPP